MEGGSNMTGASTKAKEQHGDLNLSGQSAWSDLCQIETNTDNEMD